MQSANDLSSAFSSFLRETSKDGLTLIGADDGEGGVHDSPPLSDLDLYPALEVVRVAVKLLLDDDCMVVHRHLEVDVYCRVLFSLTSVVVVNRTYRSGSLK